jgi:hypothetical protein
MQTVNSEVQNMNLMSEVWHNADAKKPSFWESDSAKGLASTLGNIGGQLISSANQSKQVNPYAMQVEAACGKDPGAGLLGWTASKSKKESYSKCRTNATNAINAANLAAQKDITGTKKASASLMPLWIGLGVVGVAGIGFLIYKLS